MSRLLILLVFAFLVIAALKVANKDRQNIHPSPMPAQHLSKRKPEFRVYRTFDDAIAHHGGFFFVADPAFPYPGANYVILASRRLDQDERISNSISVQLKNYWGFKEPLSIQRKYICLKGRKYLIIRLCPVVYS